MKLGVITGITSSLDEQFKKISDMGFTTCQIYCWDEKMLTDEIAKGINYFTNKYEVDITAFWCGWGGPAVWNLYEGPLTLGLVPAAFRYARTQTLLNGAGFAKKIGVDCIATHVGFIPENPNDAEYSGLISILKFIAHHFRENGQYFLFETGQETPVTLRRTIEDTGYDNLGVNFDPANFLMYGKANPVDALGVLGKYVMGVHMKDGEYPVDGKSLGCERPLGQGSVNIPMFLSKLIQFGYDGALTIEREISGEQQIKDILFAKQILDKNILL